MSPVTCHLPENLLGRREDGRRVVGDAEGEAGARAEVVEAGDAGEVEAQARGAHLQTQARFRERLGSERRAARAPLGTESLAEARLGLQVKATGLRFDFAGIAGLNEFSPRTGLTFGVTYDSPTVFAPAK